MPLVSDNLNLKLPVYVFPCLRLWVLGNRCITHFLGGLDIFVFVPVALIPQVTQDDHLQVQNHHDCTRIAKDSSGDLEDDHLQVQIHHD